MPGIGARHCIEDRLGDPGRIIAGEVHRALQK
jgi:hypothetical protein